MEPPNSGIEHGFVVQYNTADTEQQNNISEHQHMEIKDELDTMVEVNNQIKNHIEIAMKNIKGDKSINPRIC